MILDSDLEHANFGWKIILSTPPKISIEPENDGLEDVSPFQGCILGFHVNLPGCNLLILCFFSDLKKSNMVNSASSVLLMWLSQG